MKLNNAAFILEHQSTLIERWEKELLTIKNDDDVISIADQSFEEANEEFVQFIMKMVKIHPGEASEEVSNYVKRYIQDGWPLSYFTNSLLGFQRVVLEILSEKEEEIKQLSAILLDINSWINGIINQLAHDYTGSWKNIFEMQQLSLIELSAPLIPVFEGVTVMPLIGTIDTARAALVMENLLEGVIKHGSEVVLIDITGVPVVDTMVAHHIIRAAEAVKLIGATCVLVGIRPEIAQTIVSLGIDLSDFPTKSTLKRGIESALEKVGKKIIDM